jgi:hypothetical protein
MALESFVAIMALIAATLLDPGVFFAINAGAGVVGATPELAVHTISGWGFPVTVAQMRDLAHAMGEQTLFARTGRGAILAVGMASIFGHLRPGLLCPLVPLRDHVRGGVPAGDARCRHESRAFHGAGSARPGLGAAGPHLLVPVGAFLEPSSSGLGVFPLRRRH